MSIMPQSLEFYGQMFQCLIYSQLWIHYEITEIALSNTIVCLFYFVKQILCIMQKCLDIKSNVL